MKEGINIINVQSNKTDKGEQKIKKRTINFKIQCIITKIENPKKEFK